MKLSWWEEFIITSAVTFLTVLENKVTNTTEKAALDAAIQFLKKLLAGGVSLT